MEESIQDDKAQYFRNLSCRVEGTGDVFLGEKQAQESQLYSNICLSVGWKELDRACMILMCELRLVDESC